MAESPSADTQLEAASPFELRRELSAHVPELDVRTSLKTGDIGFLHSFTTGSTVDGPGVRLVAWTTSCMFRCKFCHNPDTWTLSNGMAVPLAAAIQEIRKYEAGLKVMKGGFTLSGGEPLMQHRFAARLFAETKAMRLHNALETNGLYGGRLSDDELATIDLVILDMKAFSAEQHERVCGVPDNSAVIAFARRLAGLRRPMWLRYVLVPGLTDVPEEIAALADFAASLGVVQRVEVLPFHQMGRFKWGRLGLDYTLAETEPPSAERVEWAATLFANAGLDAL